jgi:hypothetical protein
MAGHDSSRMDDRWQGDTRVPPICGNWHHAPTSSAFYSCSNQYLSKSSISDQNSPASPQTVILGYESERSFSRSERSLPNYDPSCTVGLKEDMYYDNHHTPTPSRERRHYARSKSAAPALNRHKNSDDYWAPGQRTRSCSPPIRYQKVKTYSLHSTALAHTGSSPRPAIVEPVPSSATPLSRSYVRPYPWLSHCMSNII